MNPFTRLFWGKPQPPIVPKVAIYHVEPGGRIVAQSQEERDKEIKEHLEILVDTEDVDSVCCDKSIASLVEHLSFYRSQAEYYRGESTAQRQTILLLRDRIAHFEHMDRERMP